MSINRNGRQKGATRRAYLNRYSADRAPKGGMPRNREVLKSYTAWVDTVNEPLPATRIAFTGNGKPGMWEMTPRITTPRKAVVKSLHLAQLNQRQELFFSVCNTPLLKVRIGFNGFDQAAVYWVEWIDVTANVYKKSMTYRSKEVVVKLLERPRAIAWNVIKPWKDAAQ